MRVADWVRVFPERCYWLAEENKDLNIFLSTLFHSGQGPLSTGSVVDSREPVRGEERGGEEDWISGTYCTYFTVLLFISRTGQDGIGCVGTINALDSTMYLRINHIR